MGQFETIKSGWMNVLFYIISDGLYFETIHSYRLYACLG